ncbi:helix-turn-helix domain-containing protein [Tepidimicrobium xylanilyticum]|uniref:AraC-type DNA-binding protein n=1 Tax=Tepidimicrobium xylanilyticum TaxID=1123352 RepID=A0A1H3C1U8_9FIRM|nr:helix-turn-helix domain-containing protein [Tepidimicrobium xylanilyticum]SDX47479.1 AraC-type DNA-binding protein [Tepidimicrobium xylanilyticum]
MENVDIIQKSIDYIEENLKAELTVEELAKNSGFSLFHYYRIFQTESGMPVMQYILLRKLKNAIYEISCGKKAIDVALDYGFETYAGFFKAFKREFGTSPTQYLKKHTVNKPHKIILKQGEYIMISHKKIRKILTNWNLANVDIIDIYHEGNGFKLENVWYINGNLVLKVYKNLYRLKNDIKISKSLLKAGFESPTPMKTYDGHDYVIDDDIYFYLTNRIKGERVKSSACYKDDFEIKMQHLGAAIGKLHLALNKFDEEVLLNEPNLYETIKDWAIPEIKKYMDLPDSFYENYLKNFEGLYPDLPRHAIHRDPNPSNIIMKDGKIVGFIDFELSEKNVRIFDPCYASTAILSESFDENDFNKLQKWIAIYMDIIDGYDSICKLSHKEKQAIPFVIFAIQMICVAYFSNIEKYAKLAEVNKKFLDGYMTIKTY